MMTCKKIFQSSMLIHRGSLASLSSVVHAQISRRSLAFFGVSDFISMSLLEHQSHGIYTYKNVCVEERKNCKTRTPACNGTTACYRIGCIIVLLLFTASTFLIVSHAQEQMSSLVSPTRTLRTFSNHSDRGVTSFTLACRASRSCRVISFPYSFFFFVFCFSFSSSPQESRASVNSYRESRIETSRLFASSIILDRSADPVSRAMKLLHF